MSSPLFNPSDFDLFKKYKGSSQGEFPEAHALLRELYDKLGLIIDGLRTKGYHCDIRRNPLNQGLKYEEYHWARVYPMEHKFFKECNNKVFIVVGTTENGLNIHIDPYSSKGYICNKAAEGIKVGAWKEFSPEELELMTCKDIVNLVDLYYKTNWRNFCLFAQEFGIKEAINEINKMKINDFTKVLKSNYNLILTGAPGTGKTYLAKEIAAAFNATPENKRCVMVQFHPSYDYTDFVEGLRPVDKPNNIGFELVKGVFKQFCEDALKNVINSKKTKLEINEEGQIEDKYYKLIDQINEGSLTSIKTKTGTNLQIDEVSNNNNITFYKSDGSSGGNGVSLTRLKNLSKKYKSKKELNDIQNISNSIRDIIGGCDTSKYWAVLYYLYDKYGDISSASESESTTNHEDNKLNAYVFIIDEINRGELSKIFGELFFSIDPGYRGEKGRVKTQYQNMISDKTDPFYNGFFIPENVYIIGTMNDIDRSVESMDFAMRRRFAWIEVKAADNLAMINNKSDNEISSELKKEAISRMKALNKAIWDEQNDSGIDGLSPAYHIGGAYFSKIELYRDSTDPFEDLWQNHIKGLLYEYLRGSANPSKSIKTLKDAYDQYFVSDGNSSER